MLRQSVKAVLVVMLIFAGLASVIFWASESDLWVKCAVTAPGVSVMALLLCMSLQTDKAPDYLRQCFRYFERNGFCFAIAPRVSEGICWLAIFFQNNYERACTARVTIKPSLQFFLNKRRIDAIDVEIACGPGAFGVAYVPWAIPERFQDKMQRLDIGASVRYPGGRGKIFRYRNGLRVGSAGFRNTGWVHAAVVVLTLGQVRLSRPALVQFQLPGQVASTLPETTEMQFRQFWELGDPPLSKDTVQRLVVSVPESRTATPL